jgi:hypothetical protein
MRCVQAKVGDQRLKGEERESCNSIVVRVCECGNLNCANEIVADGFEKKSLFAYLRKPFDCVLRGAVGGVWRGRPKAGPESVHTTRVYHTPFGTFQ